MIWCQSRGSEVHRDCNDHSVLHWQLQFHNMSTSKQQTTLSHTYTHMHLRIEKSHTANSACTQTHTYMQASYGMTCYTASKTILNSISLILLWILCRFYVNWANTCKTNSLVTLQDHFNWTTKGKSWLKTVQIYQT